jgi:PIN domain nuclease of toxin-antitoxin system
MTPLLDTHVLVWWQAGGDRLSGDARRAIEGAEGLLISSLSVWEVATLARLGRVVLDRPAAVWVQDLFQDPRIQAAPLGPEAAAWAGALGPDFPGDPIDRLLYATARDLRVPLISKDERLRGYVGARGDVEMVW